MSDQADGLSKAWKFASASEYFSSHKSDNWRDMRCGIILPSGLDGAPPVTCLPELGGCGRSRDDDANYTYFVPTDMSEVQIQSAIDSFTKHGPRLFNDVEANLRRHFYLKENWQYRILALWVLQAKLSIGLPSVFYIGLGGTKGSGKTTLQAHLSALVRGHIYSNVSIAAFARRMKHGDAVCVDEIDESHGADYDSVRNALLRDGYKANGPKYERWDFKKNVGESFSVYGPKVFGYRAGIEDALRSRTFPVPTVKPLGIDGARYVRQNLWPEDDGLPDRLLDWGKTALEEYSEDNLKSIVDSETFKTKLQRAVREVGANRETELSTIALLVAEIAEVDVVDDLRAANEAVASVGDPEPLEQLRAALKALIRDAKAKGQVGLDGAIRLRQSMVRLNVNNYRILNKQKPLTDGEFAKWRRDLGVDDNLIVKPKNKTTWLILPALANEILAAGDDDGDEDDTVSHGGEANL